MSHDPVFDSIMRNLMAKHRYHQDEAGKLLTAIEAIQALSEPVAMNGPVAARGFDRNEIRNKVYALKIAYPLAPSYSSNSGPANFARQALCSAIQAHPHLNLWLAQEGIEYLDNKHRNHTKLWEACKFLGIDYGQVRLEARILHGEIIKHGEPGIDYVEHV